MKASNAGESQTKMQEALLGGSAPAGLTQVPPVTFLCLDAIN